jgi:hypothetical protein
MVAADQLLLAKARLTPQQPAQCGSSFVKTGVALHSQGVPPLTGHVPAPIISQDCGDVHSAHVAWLSQQARQHASVSRQEGHPPGQHELGSPYSGLAAVPGQLVPTCVHRTSGPHRPASRDMDWIGVLPQ